MSHRQFLKRVVLSNYKSIKECSVTLGALTMLVGQNGAGKSNFLDALRFVTEALDTSIEHALRERGGINEVRRRSSGHPTHFGIRLEWQLSSGISGIYAFRVRALQKGAFDIQQEECHLYSSDALRTEFFKVEAGAVTEKSFEVGPPASNDRLYLVAAAGLPAFRPIYDALTRMGFYNLNPEVIRELQPPDPSEVLRRDGRNLASVLSLMERDNREAFDQVISLLEKIVPGIQGVDTKQHGKKETLEFKQRVGTNENPWRFMAENMSDGTLRSLGILTALFQANVRGEKHVPFVGIEEPETALHPGAAGVLRDAIRSASENTQVAITSHSPDLLDDKDILDSNILAVVNRNGETKIGPLDDAGKTAIRDRLYTAGELLRLNQLEPDAAALDVATPKQLDLFAGGPV